MADLVQLNEATASKRRMYFYLVDATDGLTPETGEASGQPQISTNGGAFTNTGIGTLTHMGNGQYYADLTQAAVNGSVGDKILGRYKSANTAEAPSLNAYTVVTLDPHAQDVNVADIDAAAITEILDTDATGSKTKHTVGGLLWQASHGLMITDGTAQAGGASTITLEAGASAVTNFYRGCHICIEDGTGTGQGRVILSYNGTTKVATVDEAWATQPDATSEYVITHDRSLATVAALEDAATDEIWAGEGGTGSSQLTVTVQDSGATPIEGARVALWNGANNAFITSLQSAADGTAVFSQADGSYNLRVAKTLYSFTVPDPVTISGATAKTATGTAVSSTPSRVNGCVITGGVDDVGGVNLSGATVKAYANTGNLPGSGIVVASVAYGNEANAFTTTVDGSGNFSIEVPQGASVILEIPAADIKHAFTVPAEATQTLTQILAL